jgi:hypothetical protein
MSPRVAVCTPFHLNGAVRATWVPQVPFVQARMAVGLGRLGFALLAVAGDRYIAKSCTNTLTWRGAT